VDWNPKLLAVELIAALLIICWVFFIARAALRTVKLPVCWKCGYAKVRRSHTPAALGFIVSMIFLKSYRCRGCRAYFYGFHTHRQLAEDEFDLAS
jgi:hypothetical protein